MWHPNLHVPQRIDDSGKCRAITVSLTPKHIRMLDDYAQRHNISRSAALRQLIINNNSAALSHSRHAALEASVRLRKRNERQTAGPPPGAVTPPLPQQAPNLHRSGACQFEERCDHHPGDEPTEPSHGKPTL